MDVNFVRAGRQTIGTALALGLTLAMAGCGARNESIVVPSGAVGAGAPASVAGRSMKSIKHIVIIIQENRTIDNLFNGFPGADSVMSGKTSTGQTVVLRPVPLESRYDIGHSRVDGWTAFDGGRMDGFDKEWIPSTMPRSYPYGYVPRRESKPYWTLASQYVLADRMFQSNIGPSYPAHQYLIAGQSATASENPNGIDYSYTPWGCDAPAGSTVALAAPNGRDQTPVYPCFDYATIADELHAKGQTWRYYTSSIGNRIDIGGQWSAFDAIRHIRYGSGWSDVINPQSQVIQDAQAGNLPDVTWVTPTLANSDHSGSGVSGGPQWVASVVNAIGAGSDWNSTAIFITWDDWGGWYDHVPPPQLDLMGLGMRVPLIVVSPYAKRGYVSHVQHEFGSILRFVEEVKGLPSLGQTDVRADDLKDCFDFTQAPRPFTHITTSNVVQTNLSLANLPADSE